MKVYYLRSFLLVEEDSNQFIVKISFLETQKEEGRQFTHQEKKGEENRSFGKIEEKEVGCRCTPQEKKG